jgi:hypothetical protein
MKLTKMETFIVEVPPPGYGGNYWFFTKLHTDEGVYGWRVRVSVLKSNRDLFMS